MRMLCGALCCLASAASAAAVAATSATLGTDALESSEAAAGPAVLPTEALLALAVAASRLEVTPAESRVVRFTLARRGVPL